MNRLMNRLMVTPVLALAAGLTLLVGGGTLAPTAASAAAAPFTVVCTPGTLTITAVSPDGPSAANYGATCTGASFGRGQMSGHIAVTDPGSCGGGFGFAATHTDTLTTSSGESLTVIITENSCQSAADPSTF